MTLQSLSPVLALYGPFGVDVPLNCDTTTTLPGRNVTGGAEQFIAPDQQNAREILKCIVSAVFVNKKATCFTKFLNLHFSAVQFFFVNRSLHITKYLTMQHSVTVRTQYCCMYSEQCTLYPE